MKIKNNIFEISFFSILITIMILSFTLAVRDAMGISIGMNLILSYITLIVVPIAVMQILPKKAWIVVLIAVAGIGVYLYQSGIAFGLISYFLNFADSIWKYLSCQSYFNIKYTNIFIFTFILISVIISSFLIFSCGRKAKVFLIFTGIVSMTYFWFIYVEKAKLYLMYFLFGALLCYSYEIFKEKENHWKSMNNLKDSKMGLYWTVNSGAIILVALTISLAFPMNIKPIRWNWLDSTLMDVFPFIVEWRNDTLDSYSYGYSSRYNPKSLGYNDRVLGGPVNLNENVMFELKTNKVEKPLYLKGIVKDIYSGKSWSKSESQVKTYLATGTTPNLYSSDVKTQKIQISITPRNIMTSTIFYPYNLDHANYKGNKYFIDDDGEAYFSKLTKRGEAYTITALQPFVNVQKLKIDTSPISNKYIELPEGISQRVKSLSKQLTANKNSDFEKIKAIETYLRNNYKYSLTPSKVSSGREFVDYFLFETKEGYCTYFATSMAVLLRASGIPSRYVEGFIVKEDSWSGREYLIKGTSAHAWVEVKFENLGWMTFEATPAYEVFEYEIAKEASGETQKVQDEKSTEDSGNRIMPTTRDKEILRDFDEEALGENQPLKQENYKLYFAILLIIILLGWLGALIYRYLKFVRLDATAKQLAIILAFYSLIGVHIKANETIRQFFHRATVYDGDLMISNKNISLLEKSVYSASALDERETEELVRYMKYLKILTIKKIGWIKYTISWLFNINQYCKNIF